MEIEYSFTKIPTSDEVIELYNDSGLPRPTENRTRISNMLSNSNLIITAWHNNKLVGVARSITDWVWACYLSDLAVSSNYKNLGIGKELVRLTKEKVGNESMVLLLSVPTAIEFYKKIGFIKQESSFILNRNQ